MVEAGEARDGSRGSSQYTMTSRDGAVSGTSIGRAGEAEGDDDG
jgi:hypothetical protein